MINPHLLRNQWQLVADNLKRRGIVLDAAHFDQLEKSRKTTQQDSEQCRASRNEKSKAIGVAKQAGESADDLIKAVEAINDRLKILDRTLETTQDALNALLLDIPNLLHSSVPDGKTEADNIEIRHWQQPPSFDYPVRDHVSLGEQLNMIDFAIATKLASARFVTLKRQLARLHRALSQFMLDIHISENGYEEIYMPFVANSAALTGTGQLPKFEEDLFRIERDQLYLIPTAEVVVTNIVREQIIDESALPMKLVCHTPCFRREAGSYGRDTRGMLRQHQFEKVELIHISTPEQSYEALESLTAAAESILQRLALPYRVVSLCAGDIGFAAAKTYDIEVWLPGQNTYREISSCSNCETFQARRMMARFRSRQGKIDYLHTLNGSGIAVGRTLIAVMENYQQADDSIVIPEVLRPYMGGMTRIEAYQEKNAS